MRETSCSGKLCKMTGFLKIYTKSVSSFSFKEQKQFCAEWLRELLDILTYTKSRDHLAAYSVTTEKGQTYVSMVNTHRQHLHMEAWKFLALIERAGEALTLAELIKPKQGEPPQAFKFNSNEVGDVIAKLCIQNSAIEVICMTPATKDRATFIVDSTYTLCLYATLKRLKNDSERFKRLSEDAQTLLSANDPFDSVYQPLKT